VPDAVAFATKAQLAQAMLDHAFAQGVPAAWVAGDEGYGGAPALRASLERRPCAYVVAVRSNEPITVPPPVPKPRLVGLLETAASAAAKLPPDAWQRLTAGAGSKDERWYDWAWRPLAEAAPAGWQKGLLVRRSLEDGALAYYRTFAPEDTSLAALARTAGTRWRVEQCLEEAKGEAGLDQYEVRSWHSWHRHVTLSLLAHAFLAWLRQHANAFDRPNLSGGGKSARPRRPRAPTRRTWSGSASRRRGDCWRWPSPGPALARTPTQLVALATPPPSARSPLPLSTPTAP
jgi:SRSO17 transposase